MEEELSVEQQVPIRPISEPDPLDELNDFAALNVQIKSTESLKGIPSRNSESNDESNEQHVSGSPSQNRLTPQLTRQSDDDSIFDVLDVDHHLPIDEETAYNTNVNKQNLSTSHTSLVESTGNDSIDKQVLESTDGVDSKIESNTHYPVSSSTNIAEVEKTKDLLHSPIRNDSTASIKGGAEPFGESPAKDITKKEKKISATEISPARSGGKKAGKDAKQMVEEAEALAIQAKHHKLQQQQAQKELKENRLGLNKGAQRKDIKDKDNDKNLGDKSDRPEATDRSEREFRQAKLMDNNKEKDKEKKDIDKEKRRDQGQQQQRAGERRRSHPKHDFIGQSALDEKTPAEEGLTLPPVKGAQGTVQKILSKVTGSSVHKPKGAIDAEKRVNEKMSAAEKVRLPKILPTKGQQQQQHKMVSKDDSHDEEEGNGNGDDYDDVIERKVKAVADDGDNRNSLLVPPHSSPAGSQTGAVKRKSKKPLFMRMIAKARRKIMKEEQAKQEEYNKIKQNRPHRVPTRSELKEHMHKFDEMMKVHHEQQQKNHIENIRALRQARKQMEEKLNSIESIIDDRSEYDPELVSGSEGSPSPKKKLKLHKEKSTPNSINNNADDVDSIAGVSVKSDILSATPGQNKPTASSPLKKRFTTPSKIEVLSAAAPLSARESAQAKHSPRVPADKGGTTSPRSMKTKKSHSHDVEDNPGDVHVRSLFNGEVEQIDDQLFNDPSLEENSHKHEFSDLSDQLSPRTIATEVTSDWFGRLLSTESLILLD